MKSSYEKTKFNGGTSAAYEYEERKNSLYANFYDSFGVTATDLFSSPGRIEIAGNHTDHNNGLVIVGAIDCDMLCACAKSADEIKIISEGFKDVEVAVGDYEKREDEYGTSIALVKGVLKGFSQKGYKIGGFKAYMNSRIFNGAGVSSSAAYEVLIAKILDYYYNGDKIPPIELAKIGQFSENEYFGKPCGLLDQSGIALGGISLIDFADPTKPKVEKLGNSLANLGIILVNSGNHANLTANYAEIREEMSFVARYFGKSVLREVDYADFIAKLPDLKTKTSGRSILRAFHFFNENERVKELAKAIKTHNEKAVIKLINESGESSATLLQNYYPEGDKEQGIGLAVNVAKAICGDCAARVHGGGFAGTCIIFAEKSATEKISKEMKKIFGDKNVFNASVRESGTRRVE